MNTFYEFLKLLLIIEFRNKTKFFSVFIYSVLIAFVFSLFLKGIVGEIWNINFWLIFTLNALNIAFNLFRTVSHKEIRFFYNTLSPTAYFTALFLNLFILIFINNTVLLVIYSLFSGSNIFSISYVFLIFISSLAFSSNLALVSFIGIKAEGNLGIITILALPILIPIISKSITLGSKLITTNTFIKSELMFLIVSSMFFTTISLILFPMTWKN